MVLLSCTFLVSFLFLCLLAGSHAIPTQTVVDQKMALDIQHQTDDTLVRDVGARKQASNADQPSESLSLGLPEAWLQTIHQRQPKRMLTKKSARDAAELSDHMDGSGDEDDGNMGWIPGTGPRDRYRRLRKNMAPDARKNQKLIHAGGCKRLLWFTALSLPMKDNFRSEYTRLLEVALMSAKQNAPSLCPVLIYDGPPKPITTWWERMGGLVIFHELSFWGSLKEAEDSNALPKGHADFLRGTYLRVDIPDVFDRALAHFSTGKDVETAYFMYTDVDIMFLKDFTNCTMQQRPGYLMMGGEFKRGEIANAGVMYASIHSMRHEREAMLKYAKSKSFKIEGNDQGLMLDWWKKRMDLLPDQFNWKGYWGRPKPNEEPYILHWHGPKPNRCLPCYTAYPSHYQTMCKEPYCHWAYIHIFKQNARDRSMAGFYKDMLHQYEVLSENVKRTQVPGYHF